MNVELLGDSDFQTTQQNLARVWELYNEARAHSSGVQEFRARVDAGMQEFIRRVDALLSTITIGHEVSVSGTVGSLEEARRLLEQGDTSEIIAVALNLAESVSASTIFTGAPLGQGLPGHGEAPAAARCR
jgi:hypothetical protein